MDEHVAGISLIVLLMSLSILALIASADAAGRGRWYKCASAFLAFAALLIGAGALLIAIAY